MNLTTEFKAKVHRVFGTHGANWLPQLPTILAQCREKWGLAPGVMSPFVSMNYIEFTTTASGEAVALKVGVPHRELFTEMEALRLFHGRGAVHYLDADERLGAILMQRVQPGTMLWELGNNAKESAIVAEVIRNLQATVPTTHTLPTFAQWIESAFHLTRTVWDTQERMPRDLLAKAECAFSAVERSKTGDVVLHGDLHQENILFDHNAGWIAIDPKGVVGAKCLEVGRFLQNRLPADAAARRTVLQERLQILHAELGFSCELLAASGLVDCVLSHCWCFEDSTFGPDWQAGVDLAQEYCGMLGW